MTPDYESIINSYCAALTEAMKPYAKSVDNLSHIFENSPFSDVMQAYSSIPERMRDAWIQLAKSIPTIDSYATTSAIRQLSDSIPAIDKDYIQNLSLSLFDGIRFEQDEVYIAPDSSVPLPKSKDEHSDSVQVTEKGEHKMALYSFIASILIPVLLNLLQLTQNEIHHHIDATESAAYQEQVLQKLDEQTALEQVIADCLMSALEYLDSEDSPASPKDSLESQQSSGQSQAENPSSEKDAQPESPVPDISDSSFHSGNIA